jgi:transcriptional regulator with GAF, ATPase, and Fis domain
MPADFLRKAGEILRSGKPIEEKLREFCQAAGDFLPGAVSSVLLFDRDTEDFYLRTTTLRVSPSAQVVHHSSTGTIEDLALRERRSITLRESHRPTDSRFHGEMFFFPLISADEPLGVLVIQSVSQDGVATERVGALEEAVLLLSDTVGVSLREETTAQRMTKIAAINEAGINIISTLDLSRLLKLVATSASLIMEAESCVLRLLDPQTGKYGIREFYGMKAETDQQDLFRMDKKGVTEILRGKPSVLVRDTADEEPWREFAGVARTMIMLPLIRDGEIIGTVSMFDKFPHKTFYPASFNSDDMGTFEKYIRYVEKAIGNAIVFERNEKLKNLDESTPSGDTTSFPASASGSSG